MKHTSGPWEVNASQAHVGKRAANGSLDLIANLRNGIPRTDEMRANARLIAAAPALLEALETVIESHDEWRDCSDWSEALKVWTETVTLARTTIAKANGEPA